MKLSLMAARSKNNIIGNGPDIPWTAKGEQLLFKAITYNQWLLVGRKTFESMGVLPNRKYAVISRSGLSVDEENVRVYSSIDAALSDVAMVSNHMIVAGGGEIYRSMIDLVDVIHLSTIDTEVVGDVHFPQMPKNFHLVFEQGFESNINYNYQIWARQ